MDAKLYNEAWKSIEFLFFEYMDMKVGLKVANGIFTEEEEKKLYRENQEAMEEILKSCGVTLTELNAETDRIIG